MSRQLKFRGKREDNGEWVFGDYGQFHKRDGDWTHEIHCPIPKMSGSFWNEVIPETVGQFTGLYDKNGVEIYEGDIVKDGAGQVNSVVFANSTYWFNWLHLVDTVEPLEVIGNIHDKTDCE